MGREGVISSRFFGEQRQERSGELGVGGGGLSLIDFHRRTGNFLPGGAVNHLPKKFLQVAQIFTKQSKKREPYDATR